MYYARISYDKDKKRKQFLKDHLKNVSTIVSDNASKIRLSNIGALLGLIHDLGKYSAAFQKHLLEDNDNKVDHSTAGGQILHDKLQNNLDTNIKKFLVEIISLCSFSHHSGLIDMLDSSGEDNFHKRVNKSDEETHKNEILENIEPEIRDEIKNIKIDLLSKELQGICDNIKKSECSEIYKRFAFGMLARFLLSCLIDADHTDSANAMNGYNAKSENNKPNDWRIISRKLEKHILDLNADDKSSGNVKDVRKTISDECLKAGQSFNKGCYKLEVPTGGGKTLASFRFAVEMAKRHKSDRIIYAIPYTTIIEQNAEVIRRIVETDKEEKGKIVLEHHSNLYQKNQTKEQIDLNEMLMQSWDTPIIFTTNVRILETLFASGTTNIRRLHQLANSIIIFDEIQTLPIKCVHIFNNAINFLVDFCNATVVLCTATQPLLDKVNKEKGAIKLSKNSDIVNSAHKSFEGLNRVFVVDDRKAAGWSNDEIAKKAIKLSNEHKNCLVVCNLTGSAKEIFKQIKSQELQDLLIYHLSAKMCPAHRQDVLSKILDILAKQKNGVSNKKIIVVSTQVIETGIDIDFNCGIRALAGFDSIMQTAGRINRSGKIERGILYICNFNESLENSLDDINEGKNCSNRTIDDNKSNDILAISNIYAYYQYYFHNRASKMTFQGKDGKASLLENLSDNKTAINEYKRTHGQEMPKLCLTQSFKEAASEFQAIDAPTKGVIVPYGKGQNIINDLFNAIDKHNFFTMKDLLKEAQRYSVNVYPSMFKKMIGIKQLKGDLDVFYLDACYYDDNFGITQEETIDKGGANV
ncbi:MAG: CRISPR-associated helicase Cas3' [Elusimicrobiota bacterium]|jgi:CRISPR-associated endonuclease/helicase Cas3|nr:CRISPR-associated helicase Cas3' [Elusimicrobiota bacterium]